MTGVKQQMSDYAASLSVASGKEIGLRRLNCGHRLAAICIMLTFSMKSFVSGVFRFLAESKKEYLWGRLYDLQQLPGKVSSLTVHSLSNG
jgi:hypothetical protein